MTGTLIELDGLSKTFQRDFECHYGVVSDRSVDQARRIRCFGWAERVREIDNIEYACRTVAA